jgi:hypothetical protein
MKMPRQLLVAALAAATLVITAAPASPVGPDLSGYSWKAIYGAGESALKSKTGEAACLDMSKVTACPPLTGRLKA